mmetsp:Transcript_1709/g.4978  ORF Transcript_1709/g.4978 Transcript_1709/m.4978 type:complete len:405 (-) Transcript_1709:959-2173(-)
MVDGLSVMGLRYGAVEVHGIVSALKRTAFCTGRSNGRAQRAGLPLRGSCVCSTQALVHVSACLHDAQRPRSSRRRAGDGLKPLQPFQPPFVEIQGALTQIPRSRAPQSPAHTAVARPPSTDVYSGTQHNTLSDSEAEALSVSGSRSADSNELTLMKQRKIRAKKKQCANPNCQGGTGRWELRFFRPAKNSPDGLRSICDGCSNRMSTERRLRIWDGLSDTEVSAALKLRFDTGCRECLSCNTKLPASFFHWDRRRNRTTCISCRRLQYMAHKGQSTPAPPHTLQPQLCLTCQQVLPADRFNKNRSSPTGLHVRCKDCAKFKTWYAYHTMAPLPVEMQDDEFRCPECQTVKPRSAFGTSSANSQAVQHVCKQCFSRRASSRRRQNRQAVLDVLMEEQNARQPSPR